MERFFNNAGPQQPSNHYTLDPLARINFSQLNQLIEEQRYFVLHAPRQSGKTTALYGLMRHYNAGVRYRCIYVNIEAGQASREDVEGAMKGICHSLVRAARLHIGHSSVEAVFQSLVAANTWQDGFNTLITHLASVDDQQASAPRPLILLVDEIDALIGDTLISVLRQIRAGYADRPHAFPQTVVLCGVRDVRDYRIHSSRSKEVVTGGSAFNIKAESIRIGNFSEAQVNALYDMHTDETGQVFEPEARQLAWDYTRGQPWLVNALAYEITSRMKPMRDRSRPITGEVMRQAKEALVLSRATHLDQLVDKLQEPRVYNVIAPLLTGDDDLADLQTDDKEYCIDLGLVAPIAGSRGIEIANAIYREVIPRELTDIAQTSFDSTHQPRSWFKKADESIDMPKLLAAFQQFYREHSEHWLRGMQYREAGPQLLLQAYLQRIINGGGRIEREYGLGRGRTDLYITWPIGPVPTQREVVEIKVKRVKQGFDALLALGIDQTRNYMQRCNATHGHLVVFDADPAKSWDEKVARRALDADLTLWTL